MFPYLLVDIQCGNCAANGKWSPPSLGKVSGDRGDDGRTRYPTVTPRARLGKQQAARRDDPLRFAPGVDPTRHRRSAGRIAEDFIDNPAAITLKPRKLRT